MHFPVAGIDVSPLVPVAVAFGLTTLMSMGGLSGAFALLPFQVSVLGFAGPAVTPTNHLFNVVAIPSAVARYMRERRMVWPLAVMILAGTLPGALGGVWLRLRLLSDVRHFKLFVGLVLLFIASRLVVKVRRSARRPAPAPNSVEQAAPAEAFRCRTVRFDWRRIEYEFRGERHGVSTPALSALSLVVGLVGGAYGVGGGAMIAPLLVSIFELPVHTIAGATLFATWLTSLATVGAFAAVGPLTGQPSVGPDFALGMLFGLGGLVGMYTGARLQKRVPARAIEALLALVVGALALAYVVGFLRAWAAA
jgi:uncharacterized membrane protein YfcA